MTPKTRRPVAIARNAARQLDLHRPEPGARVGERREEYERADHQPQGRLAHFGRRPYRSGKMAPKAMRPASAAAGGHRAAVSASCESGRDVMRARSRPVAARHQTYRTTISPYWAFGVPEAPEEPATVTPAMGRRLRMVAAKRPTWR